MGISIVKIPLPVKCHIYVEIINFMILRSWNLLWPACCCYCQQHHYLQGQISELEITILWHVPEPTQHQLNIPSALVFGLQGPPVEHTFHQLRNCRMLADRLTINPLMPCGDSWPIKIDCPIYQSLGQELMQPEVRHYTHRGLNWIQVPFLTQANPVISGVPVSFLSPWPLCLIHEPGCLVRNSCVLSVLPDTHQCHQLQPACCQWMGVPSSVKEETELVGRLACLALGDTISMCSKLELSALAWPSP